MDCIGRNSQSPVRSGSKSHTLAGLDMASTTAPAEITDSLPVRTFMQTAPVQRFFSPVPSVSSAVASVRSITVTPRRFSSFRRAGLKVEPHTRRVYRLV